MRLDKFLSNYAKEIIGVKTNGWEIAVYKHETRTITVYCVGRKAETQTEATFEFFTTLEDAFKRYNDITNIIRK